MAAAAVPTAVAALASLAALRLARPLAGGPAGAGAGPPTPGWPSHRASPVTGSMGGFQTTGPTAVGLPGASGGGGGNVVWARGTGAVGGSNGGSSPGDATTDDAGVAASGAAPLRHRLRFLTGGATTASPGGPAGALVHAALSARGSGEVGPPGSAGRPRWRGRRWQIPGRRAGVAGSCTVGR